MNREVALAHLPQYASQFWKLAGNARVFAFHGPMGAGKTTLIAALCRARGVHDTVGSPTFSIINEYAYAENGSLQPLYHIDLYRLADAEEVEQTGVADSVGSGAICFVEWPEKAPQLFDENTVHLYLQANDNGTRSITLELPPAV